jgi:glutaredoxin
MLTIYGAATCTQCKTVKQFADSIGVEYAYRLIDEDVEAYQDFVEIMGRGRAAMPVCVHELNGGRFVASGVPDSFQLIRSLGE